MGDNQFLNAQIDEDTELWAAFDEWREQEGYESKSEAVRAAVRRGVMEKREKTPLQKALSAAAVVFVGFAGFMQVLAIASVIAPLLALNGALLFGSLAWFANYGASNHSVIGALQSSTQSAPMEVAD